MSIRLIVSDIEGCVIPADRSRWDYEAIQALAAYNQRARKDPALPPLTLCSGRPAQFLDAIGQAVRVFRPAAAENGAVLYYPEFGTIEPLFDVAERERFRALKKFLYERYVRDGSMKMAHGKEICISLVPLQREHWPSIQALRDHLVEVLTQEFGADPTTLAITYSAGAVDITPAGIDKAHGVRAICERLQIAPDQVLAIGDGGNDVPMLELAGYSAVPANAQASAAAVASLRASATEARGVLEIIERVTGYRAG